MVVTILVAVIGGVGSVFGAYLISRTNGQDKVLNDIHIEVNSRLSEALLELRRMQSLIDLSRETGMPVPPRYGRRAFDSLIAPPTDPPPAS